MAEMMKSVLAMLLLGLSAVSFNAAFAHGGAGPKRDGVVATASDLSFELVARDGGAVIYLEDHGKPVTPSGLNGRLTVLNGAEKSLTEPLVAGDKLQAGGIKLARGAMVVASLTIPAAIAITVRFRVK
jgi:hypothetical protein